jgi:hypothetical protein
MNDAVTITIPDLAAYVAELQQLPRLMKDRVMRGAVATGASVIRKAAIALAPESTGPVAQGHPPPGTLKKAIYQTRLPEKCGATIEAFKVDVRTGHDPVSPGRKRSSVDAYYAVWVERGHFTRTPGLTATQHRKARIGGTAAAQGAKWVPPQPFMRPAFLANQEAAERAMKQYLDDNLHAATDALRFLKAKR